MKKYKVIGQRAAALALGVSMLALLGCNKQEEVAQEFVTTMVNSEELDLNIQDKMVVDFLATYGMTNLESQQLKYNTENKGLSDLNESPYQNNNDSNKNGEDFDNIVLDIINEIRKSTTDQELLENIDKNLNIYLNQPDYDFHEYVLHDILFNASCSNMSINESSDLLNLNNLYYFNNCGKFEELYANEIMLFEKVLKFGKYEMYRILGHESGGYLITNHDNKMIAVLEGNVNVVLDKYDVKIESFKSLLDKMNMSECSKKLYDKDEFDNLVIMNLLLRMNLVLNSVQEERELIPAEEVHILVSYSSEESEVELTRPKYRIVTEQMPNYFNAGEFVVSDVSNPYGYARIMTHLYKENSFVIGEYFDLEKQQRDSYYGYANDEMMPLNMFLEENGYGYLTKSEYTKEELQNITEYLNQQFKLSRGR